jgi:hypothetical protein
MDYKVRPFLKIASKTIVGPGEGKTGGFPDSGMGNMGEEESHLDPQCTPTVKRPTH